MPSFVLRRQAGKCGKCVAAPWDIRLPVSGAELPDALLVSCYTLVGDRGDRGGTLSLTLSLSLSHTLAAYLLSVSEE